MLPSILGAARLSLATASRRTMASEASSVAKIPKPEMRGFLISYIKKNMIASFVFSSVLAGAYWYFVARQRKLNYEEFYRTYDAQKDYERMKRAGIFQCVNNDE